MDDPYPSFFSIFGVLGLVFANAVFVAVEFALVRARETKLSSPEFLSKIGSKSALFLTRNLDQSISATQLGITITSLTLGWWGELTFQRLIIHGVTWMGEPFSIWVSHGIATALALTFVTFLHVVLGELVPKTLAIRNAETMLRYLAPTMVLFYRVLRPFVIVLNGSGNLFLRLLSLGGPMSSDETAHSTAELAMLISQSTESGVLDKDEEQMIKGVFEFSNTVAREVMTPRTDVISVPSDATLEQVLAVVGESGFSRIPVVGSSVDDIIGVLLVKELLPNLRTLSNDPATFDVANYMREPYFIPGTKPIDDLLREFKLRKIHMAVVLDEHGGVDGVVSLEDLLEEIVGDIYDESDIAERDIIFRDDGDMFVDGGVLVADLNTRFDLSMPEGDYDTVAGFIITALGRIPVVGDTIELGERGSVHVPGNRRADGEGLEESERKRAVFTVHRVRRNRIATIRLHLIPVEEESEPKTAVTGYFAPDITDSNIAESKTDRSASELEDLIPLEGNKS